MACALNEDCLLHIFEFLPCRDKLNVQMVCKSWKAACERTWRNIYQLRACKEGSNNKGSVDYFLCKSILQRCFKLITKLNLSCTSHSREDTLMDYKHYDKNLAGHGCAEKKNQTCDIKYVSMDCCNIEELTVSSCIMPCNDEFLSGLFRRNEKIYSVELIELNLSGWCLLDLPFRTLRSMILASCLFSEVDFNSISFPVKLEIMSLRHSEIKNQDVSQLLSSNLRQLDLSLNLIDPTYDEFDDYMRFLLIYELETQHLILKNLRILILGRLWINDHFLSLIAGNCSELLALDISYCKDVSDQGVQNLANMSKLKLLIVDGLNLTDQGLQSLNPNLRIVSALHTPKLTIRGYCIMLQRLNCLEKLVMGHRDLASHFVNRVIESMTGVERATPLEIVLYQVGFSYDMLVSEPSFMQVTIREGSLNVYFSRYL